MNSSITAGAQHATAARGMARLQATHPEMSPSRLTAQNIANHAHVPVWLKPASSQSTRQPSSDLGKRVYATPPLDITVFQKRIDALQSLPGREHEHAGDYFRYLVAGLADKCGNTTALFAAMASIDFDRMATARSCDAQQARAWLVLRALSRSAVGLDILHALYGDRAPTGMQHILLQTADAQDGREAGAFATLDALHRQDFIQDSMDASPAAIVARGKYARPGSPSLAQQAWRAARQAIEQGEASLTASQQGAIYAWEQGYRSAEEGSPLAKVSQALHQFEGRAVARAGEAVHPLKLQLGAYRSPLDAVPLTQDDASTQAQATRIREALFQELAGLQPGDSRTYTTGYRLFAGLDAVAIVLSSLVDWTGTLAIVLDPHLTYAPGSFVRIERTRDGAEIYVGQSKDIKTSGGVGLLAGPNIGLGKLFSMRPGALFYAGAAEHRTQRKGAKIHIAESQWSALQRPQQVLGHLFRPTETSLVASPTNTWNAFAQFAREGKHDDVSISWSEEHRRHRLGVGLLEVGPSAAVNVGDRLQPRAAFGFAPSATRHQIRLTEVDRGGRFQRMKFQAASGWETRGAFYTGIAAPATLYDGGPAVAAVPDWAKYWFTRCLPRPVRSLMRTRARNTTLGSSIELLLKDGKLQPSCAMEVTFSSFEAFSRVARSERYLYSASLAERMRGKDAESQRKHVEGAREELTDFIAKAHEGRHDTSRYVMRYALTTQAHEDLESDLNLLASCASQDLPTRALIEQRIAARLESHTSWTLQEMSTHALRSSNGQRFFRFFLEFGARRKHEGQQVMQRLNGSGVWSRPPAPPVPPAAAKPGLLRSAGDRLAQLIHR